MLILSRIGGVGQAFFVAYCGDFDKIILLCISKG
jgi:hypothetical protein